MSFGEAFGAKGTPPRQESPAEKNAREAQIVGGALGQLADLKGKVLSDIVKVPEKALTKINSSVKGQVVLNKVMLEPVKGKASWTTTEDDGSGSAKDKRTSEVSLSGVAEEDRLLMQGKELFLGLYGFPVKDSDRYEGTIKVTLPVVIRDAGSREEVDSKRHLPVDLDQEFKPFGGIDAYPNGKLIKLLSKNFGETTSDLKYETTFDGELDEKTGIFSGVKKIEIKFKQNIKDVNPGVVAHSNEYHPRSEHVDDKEKKDKKNETCADCPKERPKVEKAKEAMPKLGDSTIKLDYSSLTQDPDGTLHFKSKDPLVKDSKVDATFTESIDGRYTIRLKITSGSTTYEYLSKLPVPPSKSQWDLEFTKV